MKRLSEVISMLEKIKDKIGDLPAYILDHEANIMCDFTGVAKLEVSKDNPIALISCAHGLEKLQSKVNTPENSIWN